MIKVYCGSNQGNTEIPCEIKKFPGGELHPELNTDMIIPGEADFFIIEAHASSSDVVMAIPLIKDILDRYNDKYASQVPAILVLPYVPYARQDKVTVEGTALSIKVFANIINSCNFANITIVDPHSDVTTALFDKCSVHPQVEAFVDAQATKAVSTSDILMVFPDNGAEKKIEQYREWFGSKNLNTATCKKTRNQKTGELSGFDVSEVVTALETTGLKKILVVDDICDGGGTFMGIAEAIHRSEALTGDMQLCLHVTHGIFSKGFDSLNKAYSQVGCRYDWTNNFEKKSLTSLFPGSEEL